MNEEQRKAAEQVKKMQERRQAAIERIAQSKEFDKKVQAIDAEVEQQTATIMEAEGYGMAPIEKLEQISHMDSRGKVYADRLVDSQDWVENYNRDEFLKLHANGCFDKEDLLEVAHTAAFLINLGYQTLCQAPWDEMCKAMPDLVKIHPKKEAHQKIGRITMEFFNKWTQEQLEIAGQSFKSKKAVNLNELYIKHSHFLGGMNPPLDGWDSYEFNASSEYTDEIEVGSAPEPKESDEERDWEAEGGQLKTDADQMEDFEQELKNEDSGHQPS